VFILPKRIIYLLEQKFNRFLWNGGDVKAHAKVSWERLCVPKKEGGLGIRRIDLWNQVSMLNHIWNLFAKAGSLWVAWIEANWLKGRSLWQLSIPKSCSWSWKKILQLRDIAKSFIRFQVGDGSNIFLWHDHWHPIGYLCDHYGFRVIYDSGFHTNIKLSSIILNGDWFWQGVRSEALVDIQSQLPGIKIGGVDTPIWLSKKGTFSCAETWDRLRVKFPEVSWWKLVWFFLSWRDGGSGSPFLFL
jgi:hypothetical protein